MAPIRIGKEATESSVQQARRRAAWKFTRKNLEANEWEEEHQMVESNAGPSHRGFLPDSMVRHRALRQPYMHCWKSAASAAALARFSL